MWFLSATCARYHNPRRPGGPSRWQPLRLAGGAAARGRRSHGHRDESLTLTRSQTRIPSPGPASHRDRDRDESTDLNLSHRAADVEVSLGPRRQLVTRSACRRWPRVQARAGQV